MSERRKTWLVMFVVAACIGATVFFFANGRGARVNPVAQDGADQGSADIAAVDGVIRYWDTEPTQSRPAGRFPLIKSDANPHVKSVAEAISEGKHPERISPLIAPEEFNLESFTKNPEAYLNTVEPGRVWQVAQPGANVNRIKANTQFLHHLQQGESVSLQVKVSPKAPVTFTSFDGGSFQNLLTSITVQADSEGLASAQMTATTGVVGDVNILAGSPVDTGLIRFVVHVYPPKLTAGNNN